MKKIRVFFLYFFLLTFNFLFLTSRVEAQYVPQPFQTSGLAEQSEVLCYPMDLTCDPKKNSASCTHELANDYFKPKSGVELEMREGAGLDQGTSVKGLHCGMTKGTPLVLNESSEYCLGAQPCYWPGWIREVTMNYSPFTMKDNLQIPFVEQMARHWAGTMDTEHLTPEEFDNLIIRASTPSVPGVSSGENGPDQLDAVNEIRERTGALQKLLPEDYQDTLKCNFAKWTAERRVADRPTLYNGYKPDGQVMIQLLATACRNEVCPTGMKDRGKCLVDYDQGTYLASGPYGAYAPGPAWRKMNIIPNDKSTGVLYFDVFDDETYQLEQMYPELQKAGLAANELFRLFSTIDTQKQFYKLPYYDNLMGNPLDKNQVAKDRIWDAAVGYTSMYRNKTIKTSMASVIDTRIDEEIREEINSFSVKKQDSQKAGFFGKTEGWEKLSTAFKKALAKTLNDKKIKLPEISVSAVEEKIIDSLYVLSEKLPQKGFLASVGRVLAASIGNKKKCTPNGSNCCPPTVEGQASCGKACELTRKGPSFTTVWPRSYPANHAILGLDFSKALDSPEQMVRYFYNDGMGSLVDPFAPECGGPKYMVQQKRVVDIYNSVPYLASIWVQATDPVFGFMSNTKPKDAKGAGIKLEGIGCLNTQNNVLDQDGKFLIQNAHMIMNYGFGVPTTDGGWPTTDTDGALNIDVSLDRANPNNLNPRKGPFDPYQGKITYYRVAGVCNADMWWGERVLNPLLKNLGSGSSANNQTPAAPLECNENQNKIDLKKICTATGAVNDPKFSQKLWSWDFCAEITDPEPAACEPYRQYFETHPDADDGEAQDATGCYWADCKGWCRGCPGGSKGCGAFYTTFIKSGSDILNGRADSCVPK